MARLRVKKRKEKHGKHAVFFFYAPCAYTVFIPQKTCRYTEIRTERALQLHLVNSMLQLVHELPGRPSGTAAAADLPGGGCGPELFRREVRPRLF